MSESQPTCRAITRDETVPLRHAVLRPNAPVDDVYFPSDEVDGTFHAGAFLDGELVAVGTISPEPRGADAPGGAAPTLEDDQGCAWRVRGMATADWARSRGAGACVLELCTEQARASGARIAWCNARIGAVRFYEREGWSRVSEEFDLTGIGPHFVMERRLVD
ncbi:MAG: family N-acetyltransferase [Thermoleophilia bacterium]|nr:family N-acetyltransferase [Thermoleophilia bacterium]